MARKTMAQVMPAGWERVGVTWCKTSLDTRAEVSRQRDHFGTGLIEWHALVWIGRDRDRPIVDTFTGQDFHSALALAEGQL